MNKHIKAIADEMVTQELDHTNHPYWVVMDKVKVAANRDIDDYDFKERVDSDCADEEDLCDLCYGRSMRDKELDDECTECKDDAFWYYSLKDEVSFYAGIFFTKKACQDHIEAKRHHYENPSTYCFSFCNNPEMMAIQKHVIQSGRRKVPGDYS